MSYFNHHAPDEALPDASGNNDNNNTDASVDDTHNPYFYIASRSREDIIAGEVPSSTSMRHYPNQQQQHPPSFISTDPFATPSDQIPDTVRSFSSQNIGLGIGNANGSVIGNYLPDVSRPGSALSAATTGVHVQSVNVHGSAFDGSQPPSPVHGSFIPGHARHPSHSTTNVFRDSLACPPPRVLSTLTSRHAPSGGLTSPSVSQRGLSRKLSLKRNKSTALLDLDKNPIEKPWLKKRDPRATMSWWLTVAMMFLGAVAGAVVCVFGVKDLKFVDGDVCLILDEDFSEGFDENIWFREVEMGGFGNGQFQMTTNSENNSFVDNSILYIVPTLTSDIIGTESIFDGFTFNITGCTSTNLTACGAVSNMTTKSVINPVMSARLSTKNSHSIQYGRVEVKAKLPRGDWIWPSIWMLPVNETYGPWPMSGEIDIMSARGNSAEYTKQGLNFVRSSLHWGPVEFINSVAKTFGWYTHRRQKFSEKFHTYALEWDQDFVRMYVDTRLHATLDVRFNKPFFDRGDYPPTVFNGTQEIVLRDPWINSDSHNTAPFDRPFYLLLDVAVGGTNGWFPDGEGDKPWLDGSLTAMYDFARAQEEWYETWPKDLRDRALAVESVKMWQKC